MTTGDAAEATLHLHAERLLVSRRVVGTAVVRATRVTSTREEAVDEPLVNEEVLVERVPINRPVEAVPAIRHEGDITIYPVVEEVLVVERRLVLKEEVRVSRVRTSRQHAETVSLRSQAAVITRTPIEVPTSGDTEMADTGPSKRLSTINPEGAYPMDDETLVAVYDTPAHASLAVADLKEAGIPDSAISMHANDTGVPSTTAVVPVRQEGFWAGIFGGDPEQDATVYDRSMASGSTVVVVKGSESYSAKAAEILESHSPVDMDERATGYGLTQTTRTREPPAGTAASASGNGGTIQLSEERLSVGKRVVNRGGTRIRRFVIERPVEEQVTLHQEHVSLERRPVTDGRPVTNADFTDKTIEMTETAEEVVVAKEAFVTEEISLKKTATDRVETVRDTVRKEEVEIVEIPGETATTLSTEPMKPASPKI